MNTILEKIDNEEVNDFDLDLDAMDVPADMVKPKVKPDKIDTIVKILEQCDAHYVAKEKKWFTATLRRGTRRSRDLVFYDFDDAAMKANIKSELVLQAKANGVTSRFDLAGISVEAFMTTSGIVEGEVVTRQMNLDTLATDVGRYKWVLTASPVECGDREYNYTKITRKHWLVNTPEWANRTPEAGPQGLLLKCLGNGREDVMEAIARWYVANAMPNLDETRHGWPALCISGAQGSGKGLLGEAMRTGMHGAKSVAIWKMGSEFHDGIETAGTLYLDEAAFKGEDDAWVKQMIGNSQIRVNPKGLKGFQMDVSYSVYATTNGVKGALPMSQDPTENRRISAVIAPRGLIPFVMENQGWTRAETEHWVVRELVPALHDDQACANHLAWCMERWDITPNQTPAPFHGEDYGVLLGNQRTSALSELINAVKDLDAMRYTALSAKDLKTAINERLRAEGSKPTSADAWKHLFAEFQQAVPTWELADKAVKIGESSKTGMLVKKGVVGKRHRLALEADVKDAVNGSGIVELEAALEKETKDTDEELTGKNWGMPD